MTSVAVIAHRKKSLGSGLPELRRLLADRGIDDPIWYEVRKSREAPDAAEQAVKDGAELLLLWGGDGTVQRSIDALAGSAVTVGVIPAGTANLLAGNLGIPTDLAAAVDIALEGRRRALDLGVINRERFAVMAGAGFDAIMMKATRGQMKDRFGQMAYVWTGTHATWAEPVKMSIQVDGADWFKARASCVLLGNMGTLTTGLTAFPEARPDDGLLEVGVVTAHGPVQWAKVLTHLLRGKPERSKLVCTTRGRRVDVKFERPVPYELDGGARHGTRRLQARDRSRSNHGGRTLRTNRAEQTDQERQAAVILAITLAVMVVAGLVVWPVFRYWSAALLAPRIETVSISEEVHRHSRLASAMTRRLDPTTLAGLALTTAAAVIVIGSSAFGLVLLMVRNHLGFADFDLSAARFAARHATPTTTDVLRDVTQLGGAVVLVPVALVVCAVASRRHGLVATAAFLTLTVGGQFGVADLIKWIVDRARPDIDRLTGFSGPSFPSGHATASAACFAAFALVFGIGRSPRVQATLAAVAVGLAAGIACTRVFLGVHWLTDVLGGLALGWTWFALCSIAFGGRLLRFGAPAEDVQRAVDADQLLEGGRAVA